MTLPSPFIQHPRRHTQAHTCGQHRQRPAHPRPSRLGRVHEQSHIARGPRAAGLRQGLPPRLLANVLAHRQVVAGPLQGCQVRPAAVCCVQGQAVVVRLGGGRAGGRTQHVPPLRARGDGQRSGGHGPRRDRTARMHGQQVWRLSSWRSAPRRCRHAMHSGGSDSSRPPCRRPVRRCLHHVHISLASGQGRVRLRGPYMRGLSMLQRSALCYIISDAILLLSAGSELTETGQQNGKQRQVCPKASRHAVTSQQVHVEIKSGQEAGINAPAQAGVAHETRDGGRVKLQGCRRCAAGWKLPLWRRLCPRHLHRTHDVKCSQHGQLL